MKTSAALMSLALFLALPAAAQRGGSSSGGSHSSGSHASGGSSSHGTSSGTSHGSSYGSASRASSGSSGGYSAHNSYAASTSGYSAGAASRIYQASGTYTGSTPAMRSAAAMPGGFVRAPYVGSLSARAAALTARATPQTPTTRANTQTASAPRGPFFTSVPRPHPGQNSFLTSGRHFHHHFHGPFFGSSLGCGFGGLNNSLGCFGGFGFDPYLSTYDGGYGLGLYYAGAYSGYSYGGQVVDSSSNYEPASAPGTYVPDALSPALPEEAAAPKPVTLLELKDGTMYGVTDYWLDHGQLHYVASYGGENAVPLDRVDLDKTVELNSANGLGFILRNAPPRPAPTLVPF